jgi:hypothetical protein
VWSADPRRQASAALRRNLRMRRYLRSGLVRVGLGLLVFGSGPLMAIIVLASLGVLADPNPNPVGPGILAALTFLPGLICLIIGVVIVANRKV